MRCAAALLVAAGCTSTGPRLDSVTPESAAPGALVQLTGDGFCGASGNCTTVTGQVQLGNEPPFYQAEPMSWGATSAQIVVPEMPSGSTQLVVDVNDQSSNAVTFVVEGGS
jgi:hypothetical protein